MSTIDDDYGYKSFVPIKERGIDGSYEQPSSIRLWDNVCTYLFLLYHCGCKRTVVYM